jgi:hypothetical protein
MEMLSASDGIKKVGKNTIWKILRHDDGSQRTAAAKKVLCNEFILRKEFLQVERLNLGSNRHLGGKIYDAKGSFACITDTKSSKPVARWRTVFISLSIMRLFKVTPLRATKLRPPLC